MFHIRPLRVGLVFFNNYCIQGPSRVSSMQQIICLGRTERKKEENSLWRKERKKEEREEGRRMDA